jgi:hypothetical protein
MGSASPESCTIHRSLCGSSYRRFLPVIGGPKIPAAKRPLAACDKLTSIAQAEHSDCANVIENSSWGFIKFSVAYSEVYLYFVVVLDPSEARPFAFPRPVILFSRSRVDCADSPLEWK